MRLKFLVARFFFIVFSILIFGTVLYLVYANIRDWNSLTVEYHFKDDARIFGLYPSDRVSEVYASPVTDNSPAGEFAPLREFQEIAASPVYLDIRYWQNFTKAKVEILYSKDPEVDFQIGYKAGRDFSWKLFTPQVSSSNNIAIARTLEQAILEIDLTQEFVERNNVHRWIFSSLNVQDLGKAIRIYGIKFTFTK